MKTNCLKFSTMSVVVLALFINVLTTYSSHAQCTQKYAYTLFTAQQFLDLIESVEEGEETLLLKNFCYESKSKSVSGEITYHSYRINHSLNDNSSKYDFDIFSVTNDTKRVEYSTSSNKNFINYKRKLISNGFIKISDSFYKKTSGAVTYYMSLDRSAHSSGTPNYYIRIWR